MKTGWFLANLIVVLLIVYALFSPTNACAEQRSIGHTNSPLFRLSDFDQCFGGGCANGVDAIEDQLEVHLQRFELLEKTLPEGSLQEEFLDRVIPVLQGEIAQLERVLSENQ